MAARSQYEELARQLSAIGTVKRGLSRVLPPDCAAGSAIVLMLLSRFGKMRMSKLTELLDIEDRLGDGEFGAGLDFVLEPPNLVLNLESPWIGSHPDQKCRGRIERRSCPTPPTRNPAV